MPDSFAEHMQLMFDLQVLALQTDMTRVISFKTGRDAQNRVFPESGSNQPFHPAVAPRRSRGARSWSSTRSASTASARWPTSSRS